MMMMMMMPTMIIKPVETKLHDFLNWGFLRTIACQTGYITTQKKSYRKKRNFFGEGGSLHDKSEANDKHTFNQHFHALISKRLTPDG